MLPDGIRFWPAAEDARRRKPCHGAVQGHSTSPTREEEEKEGFLPCLMSDARARPYVATRAPPARYPRSS